MTVRRAMVRLGISQDAVRRLIHTGELKGHQKTEGGNWIIDDPSVAAYERRRAEQKPMADDLQEWLDLAKAMRRAEQACLRRARKLKDEMRRAG